MTPLTMATLTMALLTMARLVLRQGAKAAMTLPSYHPYYGAPRAAREATGCAAPPIAPVAPVYGQG